MPSPLSRRRRLRKELTELRDAPGTLRGRLHDAAFLEETLPWLDSARTWARADLTALHMLVAARGGRRPLGAPCDADGLIVFEATQARRDVVRWGRAPGVDPDDDVGARGCGRAVEPCAAPASGVVDEGDRGHGASRVEP